MEFEFGGRVNRPAIRDERRILARVVHSARNIDATTARRLYGYRRSINTTGGRP
jgi:hypothetical protein